MKYKPLIGDQMSGSMGGVTASHNRGGTYFRQRAIPVNPGSPQQTVIRALMATLTSAWFNVLTAAQRTLWETYADNVLFIDRLGDPRNIGGLGAYVGANIPRLQASATRVDAGPTIFNRGEFTLPTIASITAPTALSLTFDNTDEWANEDDSHLIVYGSRGVNPSINFFKGPYRFAATVDGNATTAPTSPAAIIMPFTLVAGQKAFIRIRVSRADGRLSSSFRDGSIVV